MLCALLSKATFIHRLVSKKTSYLLNYDQFINIMLSSYVYITLLPSHVQIKLFLMKTKFPMLGNYISVIRFSILIVQVPPLWLIPLQIHNRTSHLQGTFSMSTLFKANFQEVFSNNTTFLENTVYLFILCWATCFFPLFWFFFKFLILSKRLYLSVWAWQEFVCYIPFFHQISWSF